MSTRSENKRIVITATAVVSAAITVASLAAHLAIRIAKRRRGVTSDEVEEFEEPITVGVADIYFDENDNVECHNPHPKSIAVCFQKQSSNFWQSENGTGISYWNESTVFEIPNRQSVNITGDIANYAKSGQMSTNMLENESESGDVSGVIRYVRIFSSVWSAAAIASSDGKYEIKKKSATTFLLGAVGQLSAARFSFHDQNDSTANFTAALTGEGGPGETWPWEYEIEVPAGISAGGLIKDFSLGLTMPAETFTQIASKRPLIAYEGSLAYRHAQRTAG